jgi:voltage-gated potassium channel Kch
MPLGRAAVRKKATKLIKESWQSQANLSFFLVLQVLISFVLPSLGFGREDFRFYSNIGYSVMIVSGVAIAWGQRKLFITGATVGVIALVVRWSAWWMGTLSMELASSWASLAGSGMIVMILLVQVFRSGRVTNVRIQGAIAAYLVLGAGWAYAYHITAILHPGSFSFPPGEMLGASDWIYFSFVTLTTVGYGDVTPVYPAARVLAMSEALAGQLYLAVMIARLVAMEIVYWQQDTTGNSNVGSTRHFWANCAVTSRPKRDKLLR